MSFASIPLTSHSAPIDEYIVLWTADKYKKLKKWHDGYLRYHTFNKRLMVYDHLMNKVCDKFLPEPEQMDVGDELVFDSHLVTIEDVKGRQAQDLRPLFEKTVDRRKERGLTATPMRTPGNPGPAGQSPTPTLLRSIQSRPSTGHGHPIYPSPAPRASPKEREPNAVVPQKRTSQGTPVVQKISYKPLKVSRVEGSHPTPARPGIGVHSNAPRKDDGKGKGGAEPSPEFELARNLFDADDDVEMLELDLERSDFATRPKPAPRARPNAPLPFKPPRPQGVAPKATVQKSGEAEEALPSPRVRAPTVAPMSQTTNPLGSSPRIPPSTIANYSQEPLSSPSFRSRPKALPILAQESPKGHNSSPPAQIVSSPDLSPEEVPGRLTLPSAASRNRRGLLCGPSGRQSRASAMVSLSRPVSTLSILDKFPKDDGSPEPAKSAQAGKKPEKAASTNVLSLKAKLPEQPKPVLRKPNVANTDGSKKCEDNLPRNNTAPEKHWKPAWNYNNSSGDSALADDSVPKHTKNNEIQAPEQYDTSSKKPKKKTEELCIFSSDEEDFEIVATRPSPKRAKRAVYLDSDSSADEFEPIRSSAVSKHLVGQSRNVELQSRQAVSEASRIWREERDS
ncbi:hypothetical protein TWF481_007717 [Arthrobotrys musiformis]|uniref:5'-3' DNA helicase ZGRF1-like N-terminal domain-containing protein n=1 Tax=Arthrobotrys musiformis TaxID=47236 RepID=A0AAV9WE38_9PEZI